MRRSAAFLVLAGLAATSLAGADDPGVAGRKAFADVARVLQSPRCMNCHPDGDAPLQTDRSVRHAMNIRRASIEAGLPCHTCHQERNSEAVGVKGGPPGAPRWNLPPKEMPMVFQNRSLHALCEQLKDPEQNGHKDMAALLEHVDHDPLVLWGWEPGGQRTRPPLGHAAFVDAFKVWMASGAPCP